MCGLAGVFVRHPKRGFALCEGAKSPCWAHRLVQKVVQDFGNKIGLRSIELVGVKESRPLAPDARRIMENPLNTAVISGACCNRIAIGAHSLRGSHAKVTQPISPPTAAK